MIAITPVRAALGVLLASSLLAGCNPNPPAISTAAPTSAETTATYEALRNLPAPKRPVPVAVYSYPDLTGQFKAAETVSTNSRAVTQGAVWMLVKSLKDAAAGQWFKVIQRANLDNLLKERQIIRETRGRAEKQSGQEQPGLPSLLFAGVILEGGIIGYDSNTVTGGLGARYLGIGGDVQYRQDTVSVYLNAVSSQTGEVLKSVMTRKTVVSYGARGSVFKFVSFQKLLEGEAGYTVNEPGQIALAQAIEHAVRSLIIEGALEGLWEFEDEVSGKEVTQAYLEDKEDDLLLGDATNAVAQALLNEDQLQEIAEARKARRQRLEEQDLRRQERQLAKERALQDKKRLAAIKAASEAEAGALAQARARARQAPIAKGEALADLDAPAKKQAGIPEATQADASATREPSSAGSTEKAAAELTPEELEDAVNNKQAEAILDMAKLEETEAANLVKVAEDLGLIKEDDGKPDDEKAVPLPEVESISQPGPVFDDKNELDEVNIEHLIPKLKPAAANAGTSPVSASLLLELTATKVEDAADGAE